MLGMPGHKSLKKENNELTELYNEQKLYGKKTGELKSTLRLSVWWTECTKYKKQPPKR